MSKLYDISEEGVIFDGYLYTEDFPCESVFGFVSADIDTYFHVQVLSKTELNNTSNTFEDEDSARICLFPTAKLHLKWKILAKDLSRDYIEEQIRLLGRR